jgi:cell wall-associated protease
MVKGQRRNLTTKILKGTLVGALIGVTAQATASVIGIIDSGTDVRHKALANQIWKNNAERLNNVDDDANGLVDDIYGWNFAENNNQVIDYKYLNLFTDDVRKFFEVQLLMMTGRATSTDVEWLKSKRDDKKFIADLGKYGNFMHGTHVTKIAVGNNMAAKSLAVKLIPTELPFQKLLTRMTNEVTEEVQKEMAAAVPAESKEVNFLIRFALKKALSRLAEEQVKGTALTFDYVASHGAQVVNGSFGVGVVQANMIALNILKALLKKDPSKETLQEFSAHFLRELNVYGARAVEKNHKVLYVFAAGNDGSDNDLFPSYPASVKTANSISVAATWEDVALASFSNFGINSVDVAAPGVGIMSAAPGDEFLAVSGTSQASPYVAEVAGAILDVNAKLTANEVKMIIMSTVDKKNFLRGKVLSGGIVNRARALAAAQLTVEQTDLSAKEASTLAFEEIPVIMDKSFGRNIQSPKLSKEMLEMMVLPSPIQF